MKVKMSMDLIYQASNDGTIVISEQSVRYSDNELLQFFEDAVQKGSWTINLQKKETGLFIYNVNVGSLAIELYVYLTNVRSSSRGRAKEQRIQLNANISKTGFEISNSKTKKCLVLGVYRRGNKNIICGWNAEKKNNQGKQKSCYVDIETIAIAMRDGFSSKRDNAGDVVCVFKPDFLHYYIMNLEKLHD
jgi:hypothetical protein